MRAKIRKIGNSFGIILSKKILEEANVTGEVSLSVEDSKIIIAPIKNNPREGWEELLRKEGAFSDNEKYLGEFENDFDKTEWTWE